MFTFGASGTYAEYATVDELHTFKLPSNVGYKEGAAVGVPYFTAYRSIVHKARAKPGDVMLVHGASGGVSCLYKDTNNTYNIGGVMALKR